MVNKFKQQPHMAHRIFRRTLWGISFILVRLLYRVEYHGLENFPADGPAIMASNHTSMADMLAIHTAVRPWIYWVSKKELFDSKLFGWAFNWLGCIPVDRFKSDSAAAREIFMALRSRSIIGMFPQGTRVAPDKIAYVRPRSGTIHFALKTGTPIIPVAIDGPFKLFKKIRVVFGPPLKLDYDPKHHYSNDELAAMTFLLMQRIYALIGIDYQLDKSANEE